jgi:hypothetical protein
MPSLIVTIPCHFKLNVLKPDTNQCREEGFPTVTPTHIGVAVRSPGLCGVDRRDPGITHGQALEVAGDLTSLDALQTI